MLNPNDTQYIMSVSSCQTRKLEFIPNQTVYWLLISTKLSDNSNLTISDKDS
jgi:hypothetical protein